LLRTSAANHARRDRTGGLPCNAQRCRCGALLWRHTGIGSLCLLSGGAILPAATAVPFLAAGGDGDTMVIKTVKSYPDLNGDPNYIASLNQQPDHGYSISADIAPRGEFTVTNGRNQFSTGLSRAREEAPALRPGPDVVAFPGGLSRNV